MKIKRTYRQKDTEMFSVITKMLLNFEKDLVDFTAFDPVFNGTFFTNWKSVLDSLIPLFPIKDSERTVLESGLLADTAAKKLAACRAKYNDVKYYAGKAFPNNKEALKEFGEGAYSKVQSSRLRMVQFMQTLHGVAEKYKTQLLAVNYMQAAIDEIASLATELRDANNAQQLKKKQRPTETRKRIEAFNTFYRTGSQVAEAALSIYRSQPDKRNLYLLAQRHHTGIKTVHIKLSAGNLRKAFLAKPLKKHKLTVANQSKETIEYWRADSMKETPAQKFMLPAAETIEMKPETPSRRFLILHNTSDKPVRIVLKKEEKKKQ